MTGFEQFFVELADTHPKWNFVYFYQDVERSRIVTGIYYTIGLSILTVFFSVIIGLVGAWMQGSKNKLARLTVQGFIQFFRNTPPFVQLLFFYFALGQFTPTHSPDGWLEVPIISNFGWAVISLSLFAGSYNVEIFRSGIEAVPVSTREAAESLGYNRFQSFTRIILPLCFRICLPSLNNNLINLVKTTTQAFGIAVPELLYQCISVYNDYSTSMNAVMLLMFIVFFLIVGLIAWSSSALERKLKIPGYGV